MSHAFHRLPLSLGTLPKRLASSRSIVQASVSASPRGIFRPQWRGLSVSTAKHSDKYEDRAKELNQKGLDEEEQKVRVRQHQIDRPWHRDKADKPPIDKEGKWVQPETKGKLLTTPTRLLKLILPLPMSVEKDKDNNSKDFGRAISPNEEIQPLALLVHPQQPLSYVERLIQAELPPVVEDGKEKMPSIYFRAENTTSEQAEKRDKSTSPHVATYSGLGHEAEEKEGDAEKSWVRWSSSTEMGDFIRDAARGREFAIEIEGYNVEMRVGVPSFNDRTHYMRMRLRRMSREIHRLAKIKHECDALAHKGAHRLAQGGFAALVVWWGIVYYITFQTKYGWDLIEPVTYLVGLTTIMGGYLYFLTISRELSYKAAMQVTVSRRQGVLYEQKGFDTQRWGHLVHEANALRREVKAVAVEYDVDWDETKDLGSEKVKQVLEKERKKGNKDDEDDEDEDDEEDEEEVRKADEKSQEKDGDQKKSS